MTATENQTIQPQFRTIDGLSIRFAKSEDRGDNALLLSPWPESLFAFEPMWARLAEHAHLVAVDLPGFGHSERRDDLLSPRAMGEFVIRLVDALGLEDPHAVGPDIGTSALLFAAAAHPGRLRSLVIGSGGAVYPLQLGEPLKDWVEAPDVEAYRSADPREIVADAMRYITRYALPESTREDYLSSYEGDRFVETMRQRAEKEPNMSDLLDLVLDAHGGLKRWSGVSTLTAKLAAGGPFWGQQGFPDAFLDETLTIDVLRQHAVFTPWTAPGQSLTFDTDPERVVLQTADGQTIDSRTSPRSSYDGNDLNSPWDALQVGYFLSYGMWNYLTTPSYSPTPGSRLARPAHGWRTARPGAG
jgi:pimeloyl-ACP methyl ester carboxylesterase